MLPAQPGANFLGGVGGESRGKYLRQKKVTRSPGFLVDPLGLHDQDMDDEEAAWLRDQRDTDEDARTRNLVLERHGETQAPVWVAEGPGLAWLCTQTEAIHSNVAAVCQAMDALLLPSALPPFRERAFHAVYERYGNALVKMMVEGLPIRPPASPRDIALALLMQLQDM